MVVDKTVKVSKEPDDLFQAALEVVRALHAGKSVLEVALGELMKLQAQVDEAKKVPADWQSEPAAVLRAGLLAGADLAQIFLL